MNAFRCHQKNSFHVGVLGELSWVMMGNYEIGIRDFWRNVFDVFTFIDYF